MRHLLTMAVAMLLGSILALPSVSACPAEKGGKMMEMMGLTADQQKQFEKLHATLMEKMVPIKAQLDVKRAEMKALWVGENPEKKAIMAKQAEMDTLRQKIREAQVDFKLSALKILKPEMRAKFMMMHSGHRGEKGEHEGCGCGGKMGGHGHEGKQGEEGGCQHEKMGDCPMMKSGDCPHHGGEQK